MEKLLQQLEESIQDQYLSRSEKKLFKGLLYDSNLDSNQLNLLRSKIYELAETRSTPTNYPLIIKWLKNVNSAIEVKSGQASNAYFSPGDACRNVIIQLINAATHDINICVFTVSDDLISKSILDAHHQGKNIRLITDNDKSLDLGSDVNQLAKAGIPIKMDETRNHMHHKFMVIDNHSVVTGSYNWTRSAAMYNHENILLTKDPGSVRSFLKEFDGLWLKMKNY
jgi:phosphatidylserine/phosphatidylglycerophosphate/cardiolipin synthase-like enzyme